MTGFDGTASGCERPVSRRHFPLQCNCGRCDARLPLGEEDRQMRLIELIRDAADLDDDLIIYAVAPWSPDADTVLVVVQGNSAEPVTFHGRQYDYFLESFIARNFIEDYAASVEGASATERERCERLIRYAQDDA
ncbi:MULTISPECIES: hypothetical protein [unclassified Novosphingobium]|uniref:hypothetical protein n=1 Tax=unclassified Novosphingobium TaxID=2644732 RepID=UPI00146D7FCD|nr:MULTISPECIES: hypothetical protein [unclassified Novosphingobium]NMN06421.1 hypothetical protein [Novosphingobium sp. SG919]NMN89134.1 hypothetical protein [Novosphingobium sp. SG916]